ncbi:MAG: UDP-N-acetylmuramate dehydrogenase [bacterium]
MKFKPQAQLTPFFTLKTVDSRGDIYVPESVDDVLVFTERHEFFHVLGGGSNVIAGSISSPVLLMGKYESSTETEMISSGEKVRVQVPAGLQVAKLLFYSEKNGLSGVEFMAGIPGTVGGAVFGNSAPEGESWDGIVKEIIYAEKGELKKMKPEFSYRSLENSPVESFVILAVELELEIKTNSYVENRIKDFSARRMKIPFPSAGSFFRNPPGKKAGKLIDEAGMKGFSVGGAAIYEKHANIVINKGGGSSEDFRKLGKTIKKEVYNKYDVFLKEEVTFWPCL